MNYNFLITMDAADATLPSFSEESQDLGTSSTSLLQKKIPEYVIRNFLLLMSMYEHNVIVLYIPFALSM